MMKRRAIIILLVVFFANAAAFSQDMEAGIFGGGSYYLGDINPGMHFMETSPAYGVVARFNQNMRLSGRLSVMLGEIAGSDSKAEYVEDRDLKFNSKITDITAVAEFNFLNYFTGSSRNYVTPYIFGGISFFMFNPKADGVELQSIGTEGQLVGFDGRKQYSKFSVAIPFGIGIKYSLTDNFGLNLEWGVRKTFTDYLDDISTTYYLPGSDINPQNPDQFLSDPTMTKGPGMQRGNPKTKDWYIITGLSVTYRFDIFGNQKCLEYNNTGSY